MPAILDPNSQGSSVGFTSTEYSYPNDLDLRPTSELHKKLITEITNRARESNNEMMKRHASWKSIDKTLTAFIEASEAEQMLKNMDSRKPISIVVPYSYATLETILTYFVTAFLDDPIFRYEGSGPEDIVGAFLMERIIQLQTVQFKTALALHTMFRDSLAYGFGAVAPVWDKKYGYKTIQAKSGFMSALFGRFISTGKTKTSVETLLYEGNKLNNIDPYLFLPDPNVPVHNIQDGEYVGWIESTNIMKLLELEHNGELFNVSYLRDITSGGKSQFNSTSNSGRNDRYGNNIKVATTTTPIDVVWMYWTLIPRQHNLSSSDAPEKWLFGMAADKYIICAKKLNLNHNLYPIVTCAPDYDGYSAAPISRLELMHGMQVALNWLFNSHIANVRKAINDMLIVDPSLININDLEKPSEGRLVRLRRAAWGRGVEGAVKQLAVADVTGNHIRDAAAIIEYMQRTSAATDAVSGMIRKSGERVTAQEDRSTRQSALSRLAKAARIASLQAMHDLAYMFASHTQQLMSKDIYIKAVGSWPDVLKAEYPPNSRIQVTPFDVLVDYDIVPKDGTSPINGDIDNWVEVFRILSQQPMLMQKFDMVRIFKHIARLAGAGDVSEFELPSAPNVQANIMPTQQVLDNVQRGNLVPIDSVR